LLGRYQRERVLLGNPQSQAGWMDLVSISGVSGFGDRVLPTGNADGGRFLFFLMAKARPLGAGTGIASGRVPCRRSPC